MIKYIVFDFDGTLVDSKVVFINSFNQLADRYGFSRMEPDNIERLRAMPIRERFSYLNFPVYKLPFFIPKFMKLYRQSIGEVVLMPGISRLLPEISARGYQLGIISSNSEDIIRQYLQKNYIKNVTAVYCSHSLFGKDRLIRKFLKKYHLHASEMLYVGDEERDIEACKKEGVKVVGVTWGYDTVETISRAQPDYIITTSTELLEMLPATIPAQVNI